MYPFIYLLIEILTEFKVYLFHTVVFVEYALLRITIQFFFEFNFCNYQVKIFKTLTQQLFVPFLLTISSLCYNSINYNYYSLHDDLNKSKRSIL